MESFLSGNNPGGKATAIFAYKKFRVREEEML